MTLHGHHTRDDNKIYINKTEVIRMKKNKSNEEDESELDVYNQYLNAGYEDILSTPQMVLSPWLGWFLRLSSLV